MSSETIVKHFPKMDNILERNGIRFVHSFYLFVAGYK